MIKLGVRYLEYAEIASVATSFLQARQLTAIPIDIEWVIESTYRSNVIPFPSLQATFNTEGFSTPNLSDIWVDEYVWKNYENRYRFTLAHELGHHLMHTNYLRKLGGYSSVMEWVDIVGLIDTKDYAYMESPANAFAGLVLVPRDHLRSEFGAGVQSLKSELAQIKRSGLKRPDYVPFVCERVADKLSRRFQVSADALTIRIQRDRLGELVP